MHPPELPHPGEEDARVGYGLPRHGRYAPALRTAALLWPLGHAAVVVAGRASAFVQRRKRDRSDLRLWCLLRVALRRLRLWRILL